MIQRVYVPATMPMVRELAAVGQLTGQMSAHAVTESLHARYPDDAVEELEFVAFVAASWGSLAQLVDVTGPPLRVVIAADSTTVTNPDGGETAVLIDGLPLSAVVSLHVDSVAEQPMIAAAVAALRSGSDGPEVDAVEDVDLHWYDVSELPVLVADVS